ncbi:MAG: amino acid adenylation domain-containing protein [Xanthomonadales bacterium]|nr:amino acid adenylation domain-containing protein [Xanthomonadales bacterium]
MFDGLDNAYPLTPLQQGMLYEGLKNPNSNVYIAYIVIDISGELDSGLLKNAWQCAVQQHETLRTRFLWEGLEEPLQLVNSSVELDWVECDSRQVSLPSSDSPLDYWLDHERSKPLVLTDTPPIRFRLLHVSDEQSTLIWTVHHLLADDWSIPLVLQSVADHYHQSLTSPEPADFGTDPQFQFVSYVDWLSREDQAQHRQWWERKLEDVKPTSVRPDYNCPDLDAGPESRHQRHMTQLGEDLSLSLVEISRNLGVTQSSVLHAAWALVIARFSGHGAALFGTSVSGRTCPLSGIDAAVGLFLNTLPTHIHIDAKQRPDDFIKSVQRQLFEQLAHEHVPLADLQRLLPVGEKRLAFESLLVVETRGPEFRIDVKDSTVSFGNIRSSNVSNIPLTVLVFPGTSTEIQLAGLESYFGQGAFAALSDEFVAVLSDFCQPGVRDLAQLLEFQSQRLDSFYPIASSIEQPAHADVADWIRSTALDRADSISIIDNDEKYTYAQLLSVAEQVARAIHEKGTTNAFVGVCLERGFNQIAAILGVVLSGKAYVPIDPKWPTARCDEMLNIADINLLVSDSNTATAISKHNLPVILTDLLVNHGDSRFVRQPGMHSDDPAYMIFTSGSTGHPKGVVISHQNLMYSTAARTVYYPESPRSFLLLSSFAFDSSVAGIFWTLCTGGSLVLPGAGKSQDIHELESQISEHQVSHTLCLPSIYSLLLRYADPDALKSLSTVIVAGEACPSNLPTLSHKVLPDTRLYNEYGPTEATVWSTVAELQPVSKEMVSQVPIGQAIPGTRAYIINEHGEVCPPGLSGELLVTGPGVSQGYHEDEKLTHARFSSPQNGSMEETGLHTYKTGDLVTLGHDGMLYFLGRTDHQLKIRGHRIEAGEITSRVERHKGVLEAVCVLQDFMGSDVSEAADKRLVCFYTLQAQPELAVGGCHPIEDPGFEDLTEDIRKSTNLLIKQELPAQFAVFRFVAVNRFPRLPNGKIDLKGFPSISDLDVRPNGEAAPSEDTPYSDAIEAKLCHLLASLLGVPSIPPGENFFTLGGDSLTAIRFVAAAREQGLALTVPMITEYTSMRELANAPELNVAPMRKRDAIPAYGESPLSPIQQWFFSSGHPQPSRWNMAFVVDMKTAVSVEDITRAIYTLIEEFPVLGSSFDKGQEGYMQFIPKTRKDQSLVQSIAPPASLSGWVESLSAVQTDFDLESGIVTRFLVASNEEQECLAFGAVIHHLVTDALSNWYIGKRIVQLLNAKGDATHRGVSTVSYREWSMLLQQEFQENDSEQTPVSGATADSWTEKRAFSQTLEISKTQLVVIRHYCEQQSVALHEYILFLLMLSGNFKSETRVDVETHGRDLLESVIDASAAVGWFTSFFPVRFSPLHDTDLLRFRDVLQRARRESATQFVRDPVHFFDCSADPSHSQTDLQSASLLYNYLAMDLAGSDQMEVEGFMLTPLTDTCFRDALSPRGHAVELLVADHHEGLALKWRVDETLAEQIGLQGWIERCRSILCDQVDAHQHFMSAGSSTEFPDSGLNANELSDFLDSLD